MWISRRGGRSTAVRLGGLNTDAGHGQGTEGTGGARVTRTLLLITGMRDNGCREIVSQALEIVTGVREVQVNLYRARAVIVHDRSCAASELIEAIERAGYGAEIGRRLAEKRNRRLTFGG